jgi:DNA-binding CsgD family transcriptional regulator
MSVRRDSGTLASDFTPTTREMAILCLVAVGLTNGEIARRLDISGHTVAQHIAEMLRRARARNRAELVARGYTTGLLSAGHWPPSGNGTP